MFPFGVVITKSGQGQNADIDAAAEPLVASPVTALYARLKAPAANTAVVYYKTDGTATTANAWPLAAGEESPIFPVPDQNLENISVIAGAINQALAYEFFL